MLMHAMPVIRKLSPVVDQRVPHLSNDCRRVLALQLEGSFDDADFCCGCLQAGECCPVVYDESGSDNIRTTVDCSSL